DRVMMTKNNYTINVMNGQEGFVSFFDPKGEGINVSFNGQVHFFSFRVSPIEKILKVYPPSKGYWLDIDTLEEVTPAQGRKKKFYQSQFRFCSDDKVNYSNFLQEL